MVNGISFENRQLLPIRLVRVAFVLSDMYVFNSHTTLHIKVLVYRQKRNKLYFVTSTDRKPAEITAKN